MAIPLMSTFLLPIALTTGGINGGEHSKLTNDTVNKSPSTLFRRQKTICTITDANITYKTKPTKGKAVVCKLWGFLSAERVH